MIGKILSTIPVQEIFSREIFTGILWGTLLDLSICVVTHSHYTNWPRFAILHIMAKSRAAKVTSVTKVTSRKSISGKVTPPVPDYVQFHSPSFYVEEENVCCYLWWLLYMENISAVNLPQRYTEMLEWLDTLGRENYIWNKRVMEINDRLYPCTIWFKEEADLLAFKLRWGIGRYNGN